MRKILLRTHSSEGNGTASERPESEPSACPLVAPMKYPKSLSQEPLDKPACSASAHRTSNVGRRGSLVIPRSRCQPQQTLRAAAPFRRACNLVCKRGTLFQHAHTSRLHLRGGVGGGKREGGLRCAGSTNPGPYTIGSHLRSGVGGGKREGSLRRAGRAQRAQQRRVGAAAIVRAHQAAHLAARAPAPACILICRRKHLQSLCSMGDQHPPAYQIVDPEHLLPIPRHARQGPPADDIRSVASRQTPSRQSSRTLTP